VIPAPIRAAALAAFVSAPAFAQTPAPPATPAPATQEGGSLRLTIEEDGLRLQATPGSTDPAEVERLRAEMQALQAELHALRSELRAEGVDVEAGVDRAEAAEPPEPPEAPEPAEALDAIPPIPPIPPIPVVGPIDDRVGFGQTVRVGPGETVNDVASFGGPAVIEGHVLGDVAAFGGPIDIRPGAIVEGDAQSFGGMVYVADEAELRGDRINFAGSRPFTPIEEQEAEHQPSFLRRVYNKLVFLLSLAGAGVLVVGLFPTRVAKVAEDIGEHPVRAAVVGTLGSIVVTVVGLLFAFTIIGIPLSFALFAMLGIGWLLGFVSLCQAVGDRLPFEQKPHGRWLAFLVGVLLVSFVGALPFVGWLAVLGISVIGIGATLSTKFGVA